LNTFNPQAYQEPAGDSKLSTWRESLRYDPVKHLLFSGSDAIRFYAKRDLLGEDGGSVRILWELAEPRRLLRNQRSDGSWSVTGKNPEKFPDVKYGLIETFKRLRVLVGKFELDKTHLAIETAVEYVFTCQTEEGDFRGFYVDQYVPHYTGLIVELLTKAGYGGDARVVKAINWLVKVRQRDGGWTYPGLTEKLSWEEGVYISSHHAETLRFDPSLPFSHSITGMALRALACHPDYVHTEEATNAGELLASRFFQPDLYKSYKAADYWVRFQYPFWWNNLVMALDSLSRIGFTSDQHKIRKGLTWLVDHQSMDGHWENSYRDSAKNIETEKAEEDRLWVTLAICRVFQRLRKG
jgi:hypothetical protein